ncbi:MAG: hypothetical protein KA354_12045 [Phycisphaerae bacterium]|nr:hypothetical protein [Phycisphaerae bacterium]
MTPTRRRRLRLAAMSVAAAVAICLLARTSFFAIQADQAAVVFRFGYPTGPSARGPGIHAKWPWEQVKILDRRVHLLVLEPAERYTARLEPILVQPIICWRVAEDATDTFLRTVGNEDSARQRLADLVWASLDAELPARPLSHWMRAGNQAHASTESALTQTVQQIGQAVQSKAHHLLGLDVLDVRLRRMAQQDRAAESLYRQAKATIESETDRIRLTTHLCLAEIKATARAESEQIIAQAESRAAAIREQGHAEADRIHSDARRMNPELTDLMRKIESYRKLVNDHTTIIMTGDESLFGRSPAASAPASTQPVQPPR